MCKVYKELLGRDKKKLIAKAQKLRNKNPLVHSSSEILGQPDWTESIIDIIDKLNDLIESGITQIKK